MTPALLTISDVARRLGVTRETVYGWIALPSDALPVVALPSGRRKVALVDLEDWLQRQRRVGDRRARASGQLVAI